MKALNNFSLRFIAFRNDGRASDNGAALSYGLRNVLIINRGRGGLNLSTTNMIDRRAKQTHMKPKLTKI